MTAFTRSDIKRSCYLLLLLSLLLSGTFRLLSVSSSPTDIREFTVRLCVLQIHEESASCVQKGQVLYNASGEPVGTVQGVRITPHTVAMYADGALYHDVPVGSKMVDLEVELAVSGILREGHFLTEDGRQISVGGTMALYGMFSQFTFLINDVMISG